VEGAVWMITFSIQQVCSCKQSYSPMKGAGWRCTVFLSAGFWNSGVLYSRELLQTMEVKCTGESEQKVFLQAELIEWAHKKISLRPEPDNKGQAVNHSTLLTVRFNQHHTRHYIGSIGSSRVYFFFIFYFSHMKTQSHGAVENRKSRATSCVTKLIRILLQQTINHKTLQMYSKWTACIFVLKSGRRKQRASFVAPAQAVQCGLEGLRGLSVALI